jgi:hypothetical protein
MTDWLAYAAPFASMLGGLAAFAGFLLNASALRLSTKARRLETLAGLQARFYTSPEMGEIRRLIETGTKDEIDAVINVVKATPESDRLDGYLNFFEWIAFLEESRSLSYEEVYGLFGYCLAQIKKRPELVAYLKKYSYEKLSRLLNKVNLP